jgi:hypothetical protein
MMTQSIPVDENGVRMVCDTCGITNEELEKRADPNALSRLARNPKLRICSGCLSVYYCGAACQKQQWNSHRDVCNQKQREREINPNENAEAPPSSEQQQQ